MSGPVKKIRGHHPEDARSPIHRHRAISVSSYALEDAAKQLGDIPPRIVEALAQTHHMTIKKNGSRRYISARVLNQLRQLPEIEAMHQMAQLDNMGGEMTDAELRDLSETRPGRLPWQMYPQQ